MAVTSERPAAAADTSVEVQELRITLAGSGATVVDHVSFAITPGQILGLVGESGSGKTTTALALLGHTRRGLTLADGSVLVDGTDMAAANARQLRRMRGADVAYVPQDPGSALHPSLTIGSQLEEVVRAHRNEHALRDPAAQIAQTLDDVGLSGVDHLLKAYPHQLSGGQQQRVCLAMAFLLQPKVIVLDEPTTGLDVSTQRRVLDTIRTLCRTKDVAAVYVSHDLAVVSDLVDTVVVLYAGQVVEQGTTDEIFTSPAHPYTQQLLRAVPRMDSVATLHGIPGQPPRPTHRPTGCQFAPRCGLAIDECTQGTIALTTASGARHHSAVDSTHTARCIRLAAAAQGTQAADPDPIQAPAASDQAVMTISNLRARYGEKTVLHDIDLAVDRNQCVAVVGESGSGKTTLTRCLVGLHGSWTGQIELDTEPLETIARRRSTATLQKMQYIFQNPYTSLNPRKTIGEIVEGPLRRFSPQLPAQTREERVISALSDVALHESMWSTYPDQLSGGERQRVAIARALIVDPQLLVCDEITSALDVSVQATVVELLRRLQRERELGMLFITHNLALVHSIAQHVVVLSDGHIVESGPATQIFENPQHPYTIQLMEDAPA